MKRPGNIKNRHELGRYGSDAKVAFRAKVEWEGFPVRNPYAADRFIRRLGRFL